MSLWLVAAGATVAASAADVAPVPAPSTADIEASGAAIVAAIRAEVASMARWRDADIQVELSGRLREADLPAEGETLRLAPESLKIGRRNVLAPVDVLRDGKTVRSLWVPAVVRVQSVALTATRRIASGETLTEADVAESRVETTDLGAAWARDAVDVLGKTARQDFAAGAPLPAAAFAEPLAIRRGDTVSLRLERDGILLTSTAKAVDDGRVGEFIRVRNIAFSSVLRARVTGRSTVTLQ